MNPKFRVMIVCFLWFLKATSEAPSYLLVNADSGEILYSENHLVKRPPASLTKILTLYIIFDYLKSGKLKLTDSIRFSSHSVRAPPSKLFLRSGTRISVKTAIRALIVRSANDVARAIAEHISGSEYEFASLMNQTCFKLGLTDSTFYNASGLPHSEQVSSAFDLAKLSIFLIKDHPEYYNYFSERFFKISGRKYRNSNKLLGTIKGVDGIKTGFTNAAGYNLIASQKIGSTRFIGVVMGESSSKQRTKAMIKLLNLKDPTKLQVLTAQEKIEQKKQETDIWHIQTGIFPNKSRASRFLNRFKKAQKVLLKKIKGFHPIKKGKRYTTHLGSFSSREEAVKFCDLLKEKNFHCSVVVKKN